MNLENKILHISKGENGGLDVMVSRISNNLKSETLILHSQDKTNLYNKKEFIPCYKIGFEIIFPKIDKFFKFIKKLRGYPLIHVHLSNIIIFFMIPFLLGKKKVITFHKNFGMGYKELYSGEIMKLVAYGLYRSLAVPLYVNFSLLFFDKIIVLSKFQRDHLRRYALNKHFFMKKSKIIPNFIQDKNIVKRKAFSKDLSILYVGFLSKYKGVDDLIEISKDLEDTKLKFKFVGGPNSKIPSIKNRNILFTGEVPNRKINRYYDSSDFFILPSYSETFGVTILEAMSRGLVILASNLGPIKEYVKDGVNGYLFTPGDKKKIESILRGISSDKKLIEKMSRNNISLIKNYSESKIMVDYNNLYSELLCNEE
ncbi:MAG: glycosyltransferase family 4 protein [Nanoarchaeota archaeon]